MARLIPVAEWAVEVFGAHKPHRHTIANWIRNGRIRPLPRKIGRAYFCAPNAEYIDPVVDKIERMTRGS